MNDTPRRRLLIPTTRSRRYLPPVSGGSPAVAVGPVVRAHTGDAYEDATIAPRSWSIRVNIETLLYGTFGLLALLTRFWDLSYRAQHHDESLHAYFSWLFAVGDGYVHDPLMHGPTLFHANALAYLLFGDNDYTARIWPAALGVALVLMPALLRGPRLLGRWGALTCSALILFSPSLLYYTRFIRHDPFVLVMTFAIVIAALRYLEKPERRWIYTIAISAGLLFATMEVSFIIAFVLVTFVVGVIGWQVSKVGLGVLLGIGAGMLGIWKLMPALGAGPLPGIPWENPTSSNIQSFSQDLVVHPVVLASLGVLLLGGVILLGVLDRVRDRETPGWLNSVLAPVGPDTTAGAICNAFADRRALWSAIGMGLALFVVFYTSLFTNMFGLGSGTVGALGYWLGQHDVQRADQPWFFYLLLLLQYELLLVLLLPVGIFVTFRRLLPAIRSGQPVGRRTFLRGFAIYWLVVNLAVFSWAGEKMPWLTVHMTLPLVILAASVIGGAIERLEAAVERGTLSKRAAGLTVTGVVVACASWFLLWGWGSAGPWLTRENQLVRTLRPAVDDYPWLLYLPLLALLAIAIVAIVRLSIRVALPLVGVTLVAVGLLGQMHVGYRMTYVEGDVPRDMLIYVQSSPDVTRSVEEIGVLSRQMTGDLSMPIAYDSGTSWPFQWYLRDYTDRRFYGSTLNEPPDEAIVLISNENLTTENQEMLVGYTYTEYAMRWWFPEDETYRRFAIAPELNKAERQNYQTDEEGPYNALDVAESVWRSVWGMREPQQQAKMFRLLAYREMWAPIGSYNFRVYVRNDLMQTWNDIRY